MNKDELAGKADKVEDRANEIVESISRREEVAGLDGEDVEIDIDIDPEIEESDDE